MNETGFIILAAGASTRLGRPKQLLRFKGKSLLEHSVDAALQTGRGPVVTVLGANAQSISQELSGSASTIIVNELWKDGMGASIACGVSSMLQLFPSITGIIILLSDQPFISAALLNELLDKHQQTGKPIVASYYNNTTGVPAFFHRKYFPLLLQLKAQEGARKIIQGYAGEVSTVSFEKGNIDIDTPGDYDQLIGRQ